MRAVKFSELSGFVAIARHKSFNKAATELGVSASALSHAIRALEDRLQLRLLNRTTRSVSLTEPGARLFARVAPAFADIGQAVEELNILRDAPVGTIRLNVPRQAARLILIPLLEQYAAKYPRVAVEVVADDRLVDISANGFDAGVRYGESLAQDMISVPFGPPLSAAVVASPAYFQRYPIPKTPADLNSHDCIRYRFPSGKPYHWQFSRSGHALEIEVAGRMTFEDDDLIADAARRGMGIGYIYEAQVRSDVKNGFLIRVLEDWCPANPGFFLYYPSRRNPSFAFRSFVDFVRQDSQAKPARVSRKRPAMQTESQKP